MKVETIFRKNAGVPEWFALTRKLEGLVGLLRSDGVARFWSDRRGKHYGGIRLIRKYVTRYELDGQTVEKDLIVMCVENEKGETGKKCYRSETVWNGQVVVSSKIEPLEKPYETEFEWLVASKVEEPIYSELHRR